MAKRTQLRETELTRLIHRAINEEQLLTESYPCGMNNHWLTGRDSDCDMSNGMRGRCIIKRFMGSGKGECCYSSVRKCKTLESVTGGGGTKGDMVSRNKIAVSESQLLMEEQAPCDDGYTHACKSCIDSYDDKEIVAVSDENVNTGINCSCFGECGESVSDRSEFMDEPHIDEHIINKIQLTETELINLISRIISEDGPPPQGICRHGGEITQNETNKPCKTAQSRFSTISCTTDADCTDGGIWSGGNNPSFTPGDCYCDTSPIQPHQPQSGTNTATGVGRPGGIKTSHVAIEESHLNRLIKKVINEKSGRICGDDTACNDGECCYHHKCQTCETGRGIGSSSNKREMEEQGQDRRRARCKADCNKKASLIRFASQAAQIRWMRQCVRKCMGHGSLGWGR